MKWMSCLGRSVNQDEACVSDCCECLRKDAACITAKGVRGLRWSNWKGRLTLLVCSEEVMRYSTVLKKDIVLIEVVGHLH